MTSTQVLKQAECCSSSQEQKQRNK